LKISDFEKYLDHNRFSFIFSRHYDSLLIDNGREIKSLLFEKVSGESIFLISCTHINTETQNSLLKILEEPRVHTTFIFIFPNIKDIIPTLRSRMHLISMNSIIDTRFRKIDVREFINKSLYERLEQIKKITTLKNNDGEFTKSDLQAFLDDVEIISAKRPLSKKRNELLQIIINARKYMQSKGSSKKMILELIAIHL